jgi:hypothetical protein
VGRKNKGFEGDVDFAKGVEFPSGSVDSLTEVSPLPREKVSLAPVGMLTIVLSLTTLSFLLLSSFSDQHTFSPVQKSIITSEIKLSAKQFQTFSNSNVCDGTGLLSGLPNATLLITGSGWSRSQRLGSGSLNTQGQCLYTPSVEVPKSFNGGKVSAEIIFSTAKTQQFPEDVGAFPPYKTIQISLSLG